MKKQDDLFRELSQYNRERELVKLRDEVAANEINRKKEEEEQNTRDEYGKVIDRMLGQMELGALRRRLSLSDLERRLNNYTPEEIYRQDVHETCCGHNRLCDGYCEDCSDRRPR